MTCLLNMYSVIAPSPDRGLKLSIVVKAMIVPSLPQREQLHVTVWSRSTATS